MRLTTYYLGACHTCRQYVNLSNVDIDYAEECLTHWAKHAGHEGHDIQASTEYDPILEIKLRGEEPVDYLGHDEWTTKTTGPPYECMNEDDGWSYNGARFERSE